MFCIKAIVVLQYLRLLSKHIEHVVLIVIYLWLSRKVFFGLSKLYPVTEIVFVLLARLPCFEVGESKVS